MTYYTTLLLKGAFHAVLIHTFLSLTCSDLLNIVSQARQPPRAHVEILRAVSEAARMSFALTGGLSIDHTCNHFSTEPEPVCLS